MKKLIVFIAVLAGISLQHTFASSAETESHSHKYKRHVHHYKSHHMKKPHGRIDATYQN